MKNNRDNEKNRKTDVLDINKVSDFNLQNTSKEFTFKMSAIAEVEYDNGTSGELMSFFNKDIGFEEITSGIIEGLKRQHNVTAVKLTICDIINGVLKPWAHCQKVVFDYEEKMRATNGGYFYYLKHKKMMSGDNWMNDNGINYNHTTDYAN
ncbi:hypothetical protein [Flavobacterium johnsoniae]|uniref:Uncharacterized protein n=1 Tax=Flavobacterium johnsoniae TaxID=986 RepID=A0A1M5IXX2_FLAJO|nr:hypothetical protein [Flavobacterium johnsoniae]SHG32899.1 hypothetical protein SAMN05444388_102290 [Flavobacterium johnsoniae]